MSLARHLNRRSAALKFVPLQPTGRRPRAWAAVFGAAATSLPRLPLFCSSIFINFQTHQHSGNGAAQRRSACLPAALPPPPLRCSEHAQCRQSGAEGQLAR